MSDLTFSMKLENARYNHRNVPAKKWPVYFDEVFDALRRYEENEPEFLSTNADRIRAMSDEELAKELTRNPPIPCRGCEYYNHKHANCGAPNDFVCVTRYAEVLMLDWLRQPVDGERC